MNDHEKTWQDRKWTRQARAIVNGLKEFPEDSRITLVLRHSHRKTSTHAEKLSRLRLTPQGHGIAKIFGKFLPRERPVRIYHSIVERCVETAENVLSGFEQEGGTGEIMGSLESLYNIGKDAHFIISKAIEHAGKGFLTRWAAGLYPPEKIHSFSNYAMESAKEIWSLHEEGPENSLNVHVSHDLSIMGFRFGWFGLFSHEWWVSFLGGFAFTLEDGHVLLLDQGKLVKKDIPHWWNGKSSL